MRTHAPIEDALRSLRIAIAELTGRSSDARPDRTGSVDQRTMSTMSTDNEHNEHRQEPNTRNAVITEELHETIWVVAGLLDDLTVAHYTHLREQGHNQVFGNLWI